MALLSLLQSRTMSDFNSRKASAEAELKRLFPEGKWGLDIVANRYTEDNISNLWNNELRSGIKRELASRGGLADYRSFLGEMHFINISLYLRSVFDNYRSNIGWRVTIIAIPAVNAIAIGIASHYQGGQQHNQLGLASNLLFDAAKDALAAGEVAAALRGRKVVSADWDRDGLIAVPVETIAGIDVAAIPGMGCIILKDVRTTTLKKILASYIAVEAIPASETEKDLLAKLTEWEKISSMLASSVYPFRSTEEFEPFRSLALQDLSAATLRLTLKKKSSTRSIVKIFYGPPGTGKTLSAVREAVKLADPTFADKSSIENIFQRFNELHEQVAFITFHQSLQYEDMIESIRPVFNDQPIDDAADSEPAVEPSKTAEPSRSLQYKVHEGLLLKMIRRAASAPEKDFVVVIDEINRGDVSRILGPLLSTLEPDKRAGAEFPIGIELQYPRAEEIETRLYMPSNIHFLGTMNSADRNIALVDHALRRRFDFIACPPEAHLLAPTTDKSPIDVRRLLEAMNTRIEHLLDADHCIGHGYFLKAKTNLDVVEVFARKILPLLNEYFYGNAGRMLLVIGDEPKGAWNIHEVQEPERAFDRIFNISREAAAHLGYRSHETALNIKLDIRFWNPERMIPGPDDEEYAANALRKIYQQPAASEGS